MHIREHDNYVEFQAACPVNDQGTNFQAQYTGVAACLANAFHIPPNMQQQFIDYWSGSDGGTPRLGGIDSVSGINCNGTPMTIRAFMRTRFSGLPWLTAARSCYQKGTTITYDCIPCSMWIPFPSPRSFPRGPWTTSQPLMSYYSLLNPFVGDSNVIDPFCDAS
jgi:hypothetical protein